MFVNPEVTVIIPAYNTAVYIAKAIQSALNQTLHNIEVIVVDDASTDNTLEVVKTFSDERLKILKNPCNAGVSVTRNRALREAKGQWIALLDSDDWYAQNRLEELLKIAEMTEADIICDDIAFMHLGENTPWSTLLKQSGQQIEENKQVDPVYFVETGIYGRQGLHLGLSKPLFKRDFLLHNHIFYNEKLRVVEDFHFALNCLISGAKFIFVPTPYYFYLRRPGSLVTQGKVKHIDQFNDAILDLMENKNAQISPQLKHCLSKNLQELQRNRVYYNVVEPFKQKRLKQAFLNALSKPSFFWYFTMRLQAVLTRRIQYYLLGNKSAFQVLHGNK
ncbi:MAG: glycosyltransferase family 2 protein [Oculatellaceae cyanobacterium bins.114]|nr:glycosyltransferase family 2 protein [Oculatellaceae cyanobacterium bins.114]